MAGLGPVREDQELSDILQLDVAQEPVIEADPESSWDYFSQVGRKHGQAMYCWNSCLHWMFVNRSTLWNTR